MRDIIGRIVWNPWVYRITCGVLFVIVMGLARYGLQLLRESSDRGAFLAFCGCALAALFLVGWLIDRHRACPH